MPQTISIFVYIKALCTNINEKKSLEFSNNRDGSLKSLKMLVQRYLKIANQLEDILSVSRECILTAFSLMPSDDLFAKIQKLAIKSGKLVTEHPINIPENSCNNLMDIKTINSSKRGRRGKSKDCKYDQKSNLGNKEDSYLKIHNDLGNLPDPLSTVLIDDLIAVIKEPRFWKLNWNLEWSKLKINCEKYLTPLVTRHPGNMHNIDTEENYERSTNEMECLTNDIDYDEKKSLVLCASLKEKIADGSKKPAYQRKISQIKSIKVESQIDPKNDFQNDTDYDDEKTAVLSFSRKRKIGGGSKKAMNKVSQIKSLKVESKIELKNDLPRQKV